MKIPTIHLNGTGAERLLGETTAARVALRRALENLQDMTVNGRDYYVQGDEACNEAIREHRARMVKVQEVLADLTEYEAGIRAQVRS